MDILRNKSIELPGNTQGGDNNNPQLKSTMARMVDYFERQKSRKNLNAQIIFEVPNDIALERFQKFRPLKFNGEVGEKIAKK